MKRTISYILLCIVSVFLLTGAKCELISWDATNLLLTIKLTEEYHIQGTDPSYATQNLINMSAMYAEQGVDDFDRIEEVTVQNIEIIFTGAGLRIHPPSLWYAIPPSEPEAVCADCHQEGEST